MESTTDVWKEFSENEITHSAAHHLLAILELHDKRGYARVTDIAKFLDITTGSASTNLKSLRTRGLVDEDENKFLSLSEHGQMLAHAILERRHVVENFLTQVIGVSPEQSHIDACKVEHLLSEEATAKIKDFTSSYAKAA